MKDDVRTRVSKKNYQFVKKFSGFASVTFNDSLTKLIFDYLKNKKDAS